MLRITLLSLSMFACNSFDDQQQGVEPSASSFIITDGKSTFDSTELERQTTPSSVVLEIPQLNLEVREIEAGANISEETSDILHVLQLSEELPTDSPFVQDLRAERMLSVFAISTLPDEMAKEVLVEHKLTTLYAQDTELYTSEILHAIVLASDNKAQLVYIPLNSEEIPAVLFEGITYGQSIGTRFFDAQGDLL